jgi:hypothetical protein
MTAAHVKITAICNLLQPSFHGEAQIALDDSVLTQLISESQVVSVKLFIDARQGSFGCVSNIADIAACNMVSLAEYLYDKILHDQHSENRRRITTEKTCVELIRIVYYLSQIENPRGLLRPIIPCNQRITNSHKLLHFVLYCVDRLGCVARLLDVSDSNIVTVAENGGCKQFRHSLALTSDDEDIKDFVICPQNSTLLRYFDLV